MPSCLSISQESAPMGQLMSFGRESRTKPLGYRCRAAPALFGDWWAPVLRLCLFPTPCFHLATLIWRVAALARAVRGLIRLLPERPGKMEKSRKTHIKLPALKRSEFPRAYDDTPCLSRASLNNIAMSFGKFGRFRRTCFCHSHTFIEFYVQRAAHFD
ncbi:hypothetical protein ACJJTC_012156 [Scirpophaga incertulas]